MIDFVRVGMKITEYRKLKKLKQDDIAKKLFVSRQLVSKWENGTGIPSVDDLLGLCRIFQTSFEELLCLNEELITDSDDIFRGHDRLYIVRSIINGDINIDLSSCFYQFSPTERMMVLRAIKEGQISVNLSDLYPKLTPGEQAFIRKED